MNNSDTKIVNALNYLKGQQSADGCIGDFATSAWVISSVAAAGKDASSAEWSKEGKSLVDCIKKDADWFNGSSRTATDFERQIVAIVAAQRNPANFNNLNYVAKLKSMYNGTQMGAPAQLNDDAWGIIALIATGEPQSSTEIQGMAAFLEANQNSDDNGWGWGTGQPSDADSTATIIMALIAAGKTPASTNIQNAIAYLKTQQDANNAGFMSWGSVNPDSTAYTTDAIVSAGQNPTDATWQKNNTNPIEYLLNWQQSDWGFSNPYANPLGTSNVWTTANALNALLGKPYQEFKIEKTAPSTTSTVAAGWHNSDQNLGFTCIDTGSGCDKTSYRINSSNWTDYNGTGIPLAAPANESKGYLIDFNSTDRAGNAEATKSITISIDKNAPAITSFSPSTGSDWTNNATPTFNISATDSNSGNSKMRFSCSSSDWGGSNEVNYSTTYSGFNITSGASNCSTSDGAKSIYLQVKDSAGNWSASSSAATVNYDRTAPSAPSTPSVSAGNGQVTVSWGTVSDPVSGLREYRVYRDGSNYATVSNSTNSQTVTGLANGTSYAFKIGAVDYAGNESISAEISATPTTSTSPPSQDDTSLPSVAIINPAANAKVGGIVILEARAIDSGTGVNFVIFELPDKNYITVRAPATGSIYNGTWQVQWFTLNLENGKEYTVKAMAKDKGYPIHNSSAWESRTFRIDNTKALADLDKNNAKQAIANAEEKKANLEERILQSELLAPGSIALDGKTQADDLLSQAKTNYAQKKYSEARQNSDSAAEKYTAMAESLSVAKYGEKQQYEFIAEKAQIFFKAVGLNEQQIEECSLLMENCSIERAFEIKEIKQGTKTSYKAVITITLANNRAEDRQLKIIETIPKEFAESSDLIVSSENMIVLEADPKIEFDVTVKAGETKTISYALKTSLTRQAADELLGSKPLELFVAPPAMLNSSTEITGTGNNPTGLVALGFLGENAGLIGIIILVIVAIALGIFFIMRRSNNNYGGENYHPLSLESGKMDLFKSLKKKVSGEQKKEMKSGKWGYKRE